jgi:predicted XRE-type DNA-binding protein
MKTKIINGVEVITGSNNIYADLGLENAEKLKIKTGLIIKIIEAMHTQELTQDQAAKRMGISQPKVTEMIRGNFTNVSERKLMDCLTKLGYDIEIKVRPSKALLGNMMLVAC